MRFKFRLALVVISAFACIGNEDIPGRTTDTIVARDAPVAPADSIADVARQVIDAFLAASREGSESRPALDSLTRCDDAGGTSHFPSPMLASWTVESLEARGDTVVVRASVITVAEHDIDRRGNGFVARQRVRTDVLEWDVYRNAYDQWVVCNGIQFGNRGADSLTIWRPDGASHETARRLADSIRALR